MPYITSTNVIEPISMAVPNSLLETDLGPLLGCPLVMVAHPDDETACAALLQRARQPSILFCTNGAPASEFFWGRYGSPEEYAAVRRREVDRALTLIGSPRHNFLRHRDTAQYFNDQEIYREVELAFRSLLQTAAESSTDAIIAPAYRGRSPGS